MVLLYTLKKLGTDGRFKEFERGFLTNFNGLKLCEFLFVL